MPIILETTARIGRRGNIPYVGVYLVAASNGGYYINAAKPS